MAINTITKARDQIIRMNKTYPLLYKQSLEDVGRDVISKWYASYEPIIYKRQLRLTKAFRVTLDGTKYDVEFDSSFIGGNEYIFENSFMQGYHGGAISGEGHPSPGIPYWRTPIPRFSEWGRPALRSFSPYHRMISEMNKTIKQIDKKKQAEFDAIMEKVTRAINRLG